MARTYDLERFFVQLLTEIFKFLAAEINLNPTIFLIQFCWPFDNGAEFLEHIENRRFEWQPALIEDAQAIAALEQIIPQTIDFLVYKASVFVGLIQL